MRSPFGIIPIEIFSFDLHPTSIAVFAALTTFADRDRFAFPSLETLGKMVGIDPRNVRTHIRKLEAEGIISTVQRHDDHGRQSSNGYLLNLLKISGGEDAGIRDGEDAHIRGEGDAGIPQTVPEGTVPKEQLFPIEGEGDKSVTKPAKRGCQFPDGWTVGENLQVWANNNHPSVDIAREFAQFHDHHVAKGSVFKNWDAAFRTWVRNAEAYQSPKTRQGGYTGRGVDPRSTGYRRQQMDTPHT